MNTLQGSIQLPRYSTRINLRSLGNRAHPKVFEYLRALWAREVALVPDTAPPSAGEAFVAQRVSSYAYVIVGGIRYGAASRHQGLRYKYGYIEGRIPVRIAYIFHVKHPTRGAIQSSPNLSIHVRRFTVSSPPTKPPVHAVSTEY